MRATKQGRGGSAANTSRLPEQNVIVEVKNFGKRIVLWIKTRVFRTAVTYCLICTYLLIRGGTKITELELSESNNVTVAGLKAFQNWIRA